MGLCLNGLNKFLLVLVFLGIFFILLRNKEGFEGFGSALDYAYDGPYLKYFINDNPEVELLDKKDRDGITNEDIASYKQITNNVRYPTIPCQKGDYDNGICRALYKKNVLAMKKSEHCMPGFDCTRVGFFCSKIDA